MDNIKFDYIFNKFFNIENDSRCSKSDVRKVYINFVKTTKGINKFYAYIRNKNIGKISQLYFSGFYLKENKDIINTKNINAGGKNTNYYGKKFEDFTNVEDILVKEYNFEKTFINKNSKYGFYIYKKIKEIEIYYMLQSGFKLFFDKFYNIKTFRNPDECFIIKTNKKIIVKILEKKEQQTNGSVETKLWAAYSLREEYKIVLGNNFIVEYALCVNNFISSKFEDKNDKKYNILKIMLKKQKIPILYGEDEDYKFNLYNWICNF